MGIDGEPINNSEAARRSEVDRVKSLIKADDLIFREHDVDNPGPNDSDGKERDLIRSFGLEKVDTVQGLFDSMNDPNRGHEVPMEKLDILATAICESIIEKGRTDIVAAGSYSIERQLLWTGFTGKDKSSEESPSFSFMVAEKFRERIEAGEKRDEVTAVMEYLDFVKNSDYAKNGGLEGAAAQAEERLSKIRPNVLRKSEMEALAEINKYVSSIKGSRLRERKREEASTLGGSRVRETHDNPRRNVDTRVELSDILEKGSPREILNYARRLLDTLENSTYKSNDISIGETTRALNAILDHSRIKMGGETESDGLMFVDIHREIVARLALHDTAFYMEDSGFKMPERGGGLSEAAGRALSDGRELTQDVLQFLLRDAHSEKFGLPISEAWDWIQDANFEYDKVLRLVVEDLKRNNPNASDATIRKWDSWLDIKEVSYDYGPGTTVEGRKISYFMDSDNERKAKVDEFIIRSISREGYDGAKAYQLASKLVSASGERSVFNFGLIKGDNFAETIHFAYFRADDARKGKATGAMSNRGIQSLTLGWLRDMSAEKGIGKLKAKDIWIEECKEKLDFNYYFTQTMSSKVASAKAALMDSSPSPKILDSGTHFNGVVDSFAKLDPALDLIKISGQYYEIERQVEVGPDGKKTRRTVVKGVSTQPYKIVKVGENYEVILNQGDAPIKSEKSREGKNHLRSNYALGLLELIGTKPELGWDIKAIMRLRKAIVETDLSDSAKPFLNEAMWNWINKQAIAHVGSRNYDFQQLLNYNRRISGRMAFWDGFFKGISGRK